MIGRIYGAVMAHLNRGHERIVLPPVHPDAADDSPTRRVPRGFVESSHGQTAGWLGPALNPFTIDDDPSKSDYRVGSFRLPEDVGSGRSADRKRLLMTQSKPRRDTWRQATRVERPGQTSRGHMTCWDKSQVHSKRSTSIAKNIRKCEPVMDITRTDRRFLRAVHAAVGSKPACRSSRSSGRMMGSQM